MLSEANAVAFVKAHGTENDFVVLIDPDVEQDLSVERVRRLADRRAGIGGDGVIRVATAQALVHAGVLDALPDGVVGDEWFMDYRNADGSIAEMCGNGVRAFVHVLIAAGLVDTGAAEQAGGDAPVEFPVEFAVGTRAGRKPVVVHHANATDAEVSVEMGAPVVLGLSTATVGGVAVAGLGVDMGNPHLACVIPGLDADSLNGLPIEQPVVWDSAFFPAGVNLEVLTPLHDGSVAMRVHERGVGETRSCGTGTVAAAVAALADSGAVEGTVQVHVPGGVVEVTITENQSVLRGPSKIVASGTTQL